jgi:CubicO group peptidase (beta-lactamase class C family)
MAAVIDTSKGSLDSELSDILPEVFEVEGAHGGNATVRMLLSHTAGFNDEVYRGQTVSGRH